MRNPLDVPLRKIDPAEARRWQPFKHGPKELRLECRGNILARMVTSLHFAWPSSRGHWRFNQLLRKSALLRRHLRDVPFVSKSGVPLRVSIPTDQFVFLSGILCAEPFELAITKRIVRKRDVFVDVGAHWGSYLLHILGRLGEDGIYYAIEPNPANFAFLESAYASAQLRCLETAVSDVDGESWMRIEGDVGSHLDNAADGIRVRTTRLDTLLKPPEIANRSVVIKVDTEGHEAAVIRSCSGLARAGISPTFLLEFLPEINGQRRDDIIGAVTSVFGAGYTFWAIEPESAVIRRFGAAGDVSASVRNIIALPSAQLDRLEALRSLVFED